MKQCETLPLRSETVIDNNDRNVVNCKWLRPADYISTDNLLYATNRALAALGTELNINFAYAAFCKIIYTTYLKFQYFYLNLHRNYSIDIMILQFGVLFAFLAIGEYLVNLTGIPIPSSIIGMVLLCASLKLGIVKLGWVERLSGFLVHNLGFFFVPAGIGLMNCLGIIADQWIPIVLATVISTFIIIAVTGWVHQLVRSASSKLTHKFAKEAE